MRHDTDLEQNMKLFGFLCCVAAWLGYRLHAWWVGRPTATTTAPGAPPGGTVTLTLPRAPKGRRTPGGQTPQPSGPIQTAYGADRRPYSIGEAVGYPGKGQLGTLKEIVKAPWQRLGGDVMMAVVDTPTGEQAIETTKLVKV